MFPPMLLRLRVGAPDRNQPGIWLPLFLVWLILLPIIVLVLVVSIVVDVALFLAGESYHHYTLLLLRCFGVLAAARGMEVRIHADETDVDICFA
jgi:small-conductance mechanosensitive channel